MKNRDYSENYYTDPKVTHPSTKIDVSIPHEWESVSYKNDLCPSFTHKGLQIFVMDEETRIIERCDHKYSIMYYWIDDEREGTQYDPILMSNNWNEVLEFVNNYGGKNANK